MENTMAKDGINRGGARPGAGRPRKNLDGTTEHTSFTAEQLKALVDSPYVASVSSKSVSYTKAFKEFVWKEYCNGILHMCRIGSPPYMRRKAKPPLANANNLSDIGIYPA